MKAYSKEDSKYYITIEAYKNKVLVKNGFIRITKGNHKGFETIRPDILEDKYTLPKNTIIQD